MTRVFPNALVAVALAATLAGCNSIERGTTQRLVIRPDPADATCLVRHPPSPDTTPVVAGQAEVERTRYSVVVECSRPGYKETTVMKRAMFSTRLENGAAGLFDRMTGANYSYPPLIQVPLEPVGPATPPPGAK